MTWNNQYTPQFQQPQYGQQPQQGYTPQYGQPQQFQQQPYGQPQAPQQQPTEVPSLEQLLKPRGGKSAFNKDTAPGTTVTGTITNTDTREKLKYGTNQPDTYSNGSPKYVEVITIQTNLQDDPDDNGLRNVYINLWGLQRAALAEACKAAHCAKPVEGDTFTATYVGLGQAQPGMSAPKLYEYRIDHKPPVSFTQPENTPQQQAMPQQGAQQSQAHVDPMTVTQLRNAGKTEDEIARLLGVQPVDVMRVPGRAAASAEPSEPEF